MKSTINGENKIDGIKYPFLGQNINNNKVVLFSEYGVGTVVYSRPLEQNHVGNGYHSKTWDMTRFKPFNGIVTLEND